MKPVNPRVTLAVTDHSPAPSSRVGDAHSQSASGPGMTAVDTWCQARGLPERSPRMWDSAHRRPLLVSVAVSCLLSVACTSDGREEPAASEATGVAAEIARYTEFYDFDPLRAVVVAT